MNTQFNLKGKMRRSEALSKLKEAILLETDTFADAEVAKATAAGEMEDVAEAKQDSYTMDYLDEINKRIEKLQARLEGKEEEAPEEEDLGLNLDAPDEDLNLDIDASTDTIDVDSNGVDDMSTSGEDGSIYDSLAAAFKGAQATGDEKLINQIANTITYFNKTHILKRG